MQATNCGEKGQPCCPGNDNSRRCFASSAANSVGNLICSADRGVCTSCGDAGEPCCQRTPAVEPSCYIGNVCASGRCRPCGERGEPCCAGDNDSTRCFTTLSSSDRAFSLRCTSASGGGTCESCGGTGEPCCQADSTSDPFCAVGNVCSTGTCRPCGELGERCCAGDGNDDFCKAFFSSNLRVCSSSTGNGNCVQCGAPGQPCCQRSPSIAPTCTAGECVGGRCPGSPSGVRTSPASS